MQQASGDVDGDFVADLESDQGIADGGEDGDAVVGQIGIVGSEQLIDGLLLGVQIQQCDHGAERSAVGRNLGAIDHL